MDWGVTLAVGLDGQGCLLTPHVRVEGRRGFRAGTVRVELVDQRGRVSRVSRRPLLAHSLGRELRMPSFTVPAGMSPAEALRMPWDVAVEAGGMELIRWRRYLELEPASLNAEGEIELAGPPASARSKAEEEGRGPESPWDVRDSERILAALVAQGEITADVAQQVRGIHAAAGMSVERMLAVTGLVDERRVIETWADVTGSELVDLSTYPIDPRAAACIPVETARRYGLMAIGFRDEFLTIAMSDPQDPRAMFAAERATPRRTYIVGAARDNVIAALDAAGIGSAEP